MWSIQAAEVDISSGFETLTSMDLSAIAPSTYTNAELIIPQRSLMYGIYKITFTARMWDDSIEDPNWTRKLPFVNDASTYIRIKPSPLTAMLIQGGVSLMTRGKGQSVVLEPFLFSEDPDFPEDGMQWKSRPKFILLGVRI